MNDNFSLDSMRRTAGMFVAGMSLFLSVVAIAVALLRGGDDLLITTLICGTVSIAPCMLAMQKRTDPVALIIYGMSLPVYSLVLIYLMRGTSLQMDMHMVFFATLAFVTVLCDWRALVAAAAVGAVHHAALDLMAPDLVFYGDTSFNRVLLHAAVVIAETAALVWIAHKIPQLIAFVTQQSELRAEVEHAAQVEREHIYANQQIAVQELKNGLSRLAAGDLSRQIENRFPAEYEALRADYNSAITAMSEMLLSVSTTAETVRGGSSEVSSAAGNLSDRSSSQAASLEQTSAAVSQLTTSVGDATKGAEAAATAALAAKREASGSAQVMDTAIEAMNEIAASSEQMGAVVALIEGIAFQTNLLALNASVEAARAGDAGNGFAVVANEVRALAQRSATAASEIGTLIRDSGKSVTTGVQLVNETANALKRIEQSANEVSALVEDIANSSHQQFNTIKQVNVAISDLDMMTQQNAAVVEQSSAASHNLANEADRLTSLVERFSLYGARAA